MSRGFAGVVAVPAWARFMKVATTGAHPDWCWSPSRRGEGACCCRITRCPRDRRLSARHFSRAPALAGLGLVFVVAVAPLPMRRRSRSLPKNSSRSAALSRSASMHGAVAETAPATPIRALRRIRAPNRDRVNASQRRTAAIAMKGGGDLSGGFAPRSPPTGFRLRQGYGETSPERLRREGGARGPHAPRRSPAHWRSLVRAVYAMTSSSARPRARA